MTKVNYSTMSVQGPDARRALLRLLNHDNPQVRLQAAKFVYPVAREEANRCLQDIAAANFCPISPSQRGWHCIASKKFPIVLTTDVAIIRDGQNRR